MSPATDLVATPPAPDGEQAFDAYFREKMSGVVRWGLGFTAVFTLLFAPLDVALFPETWQRLWTIRFSLAAILAALTLAHHQRWIRSQSQLFLGGAVFLAGVSLFAMMALAGNAYAGFYVTGVALCLVYGGALLALRYKTLLVVGASWLVAHEMFLAPFDFLADPYLNNDRAAIVGTTLLVTLSAYLLERQTRRSFDLERQLTRRLNELEAANRAVVGAVAERKRFHSFINHELRNPITAIVCATDLLQKDVAGPTRARVTEMLARSSQVVVSILNDVLDLDRLEDGRIVFESLPVDPAVLAEFIAASERLVAEGKGIELICRSENCQRVLSDPLRIGQVVRNLLSNAVKFTQQGSVTLATTTQPVGDGRVEVRFEITDTGIGIARDRLDRLFQPFGQADDTISRRFGGTGLGLAICKQICDRLGGVLEVSSDPDHGSTFTLRVTLPVDPAADTASSSPA